MADETVRVRVVGDVGPYVSDVNKATAATRNLDKASAGTAKQLTAVEKASASVSTQMVSMAKGFGFAGATAVATQQLKESVDMAINLQDSIAKVGVVFGSAAGEIEAFADDSTRSFGLTKTAALDAASTFAIFGKSAGLSGTDLTKFSEDLTQRAVDLKSFFGGSVEDAITAVGAALRGESEPIRAYGVLLDDATLKARALTMGLISNTKDALTPQTRALAAAAEVMDQTKDAAGDYARTSDGAANSMQEMNTQLGRLKEEFGTNLLPALTDAAQALTTMIGLLGKASDAADKLTGGTFKVGTLFWWQNIPAKGGALWDLIWGTDKAAEATDDLGSASAGAAGGVDALGGAAGSTAGQVGALTTEVESALTSMNKLIDARQSLFGARRDMAGIGSDIRDAMRQPGSSGGGGGGRAKESEAEAKARQKVIDKIREQDQAEVDAETKRARRRAQAKADARADREARADTQAGVKAAIDTDKAARGGRDINGKNQTGEVGEKTGTLTKAEQKKLDKEIEGIRARHKKALDTQLKGLEKAQTAAKGTAAATDTYSTSLNENTEAGRRNLDQLDRGADTIQAVGQAAYDEAIRQGKSVEEATRISGKAMLQAREDLLKTYTSLGFATSEVDKYLRKLGLIPKDIKTKFDIDTDPAKKAINELAAWFEKKNPDLPPAIARGLAGKQIRANEGNSWAEGGYITGPGSGTSDSVPAWLSNGEYVLPTAAVDYYGREFMDSLRARRFASGGPVNPFYSQARASTGPSSSGSGASYGMFLSPGSVSIVAPNPVRAGQSVVAGLAEAAYRHGMVR